MVRMIGALEPNIALRGFSPVRRAIFKGLPMATSVHLLKLFGGLSTLAELAAWQKKNWKQQGWKASRVSSGTLDAATQPSSFPSLARFADAWRTDPRRSPALDSGMRVRSSRNARRGFHRARTSGNVALGQCSLST